VPISRKSHAAHSCGMSSDAQIRTVKVFLAEDSGALRSRIAGLLGSVATVVGEGNTPQSCIDGIFATHPDVVVLDVQLEGGQGIEVLRAVRAADPGVAFIVFSNTSAAAYRKRYLGAGAFLFLDKSTEFDKLSAAVRAAPSSPKQ
jgi:DNA-binding NarL/FixJ family response regulator